MWFVCLGRVVWAHCALLWHARRCCHRFPRSDRLHLLIHPCARLNSAKGGVGLIVTGGIAPNVAGRVSPTAAKMNSLQESLEHRVVTDAVHEHDGKIVMQILHSGRYGYHPFNVSASDLKAPIGWFQPKPLSAQGVQDTIDDYVKCAVLAREAGYDGVEVCVRAA